MGTEIILVHSSDLHVDEDRAAGSRHGDGMAGLRSVLVTACAARAFENGPPELIVFECVAGQQNHIRARRAGGYQHRTQPRHPIAVA